MELNTKRFSVGERGSPVILTVFADLEAVYVRVSCGDWKRGSADLWACAVSLTTTTDIYGRFYE